MPATPAPALSVALSRIDDALDRYQRDFDEMMDSWLEAERYRAVTRELQDLRLLRESVPQLSEEMADLLIRHAETVHSIWHAQIRLHDGAPADIKPMRARHRCAVEAMRRKCRAILSRQ